MKSSFAAKVLFVLIWVLLVAAVIIVATLPFMLGSYQHIFYGASWKNNKEPLLFFLMTVGLCGIWILGELIFMLRTVDTNPFVKRNVNALKRLGIAAVVASILFFIKCISFYTISTFICGVILVVAALFAFTLSSLFKQAVIYKEENELTI